MAVANDPATPMLERDFLSNGNAMDLTVWLATMFLLGLVTLGLMFAFVAACERI